MHFATKEFVEIIYFGSQGFDYFGRNGGHGHNHNSIWI